MRALWKSLAPSATDSHALATKLKDELSLIGADGQAEASRSPSERLFSSVANFLESMNLSAIASEVRSMFGSTEVSPKLLTAEKASCDDSSAIDESSTADTPAKRIDTGASNGEELERRRPQTTPGRMHTKEKKTLLEGHNNRQFASTSALPQGSKLQPTDVIKSRREGMLVVLPVERHRYYFCMLRFHIVLLRHVVLTIVCRPVSTWPGQLRVEL